MFQGTDRLRGAALVAAAATATGLLLSAPSAPAKPRSARKPPPVVTRSASDTGNGNRTILSATAACPKGTGVLSGGFEETAPSANATGVVYESRRVGARSWRASTQISASTASTVNLTAFAYCRRGAPRTSTIPVTFTGATYPPSQGRSGPSATVGCQPGARAIGGGFLSDPPITASVPFKAFVLGSLRSAAGAWRFDAFSLGAPGTINGYVYCARQKAPGSVSATSPPNSAGLTSSSATATCTGKRTAIGGGFSQGGTATFNQFLVAYESQRTGKGWRVSAMSSSNDPLTVTSTAYCG